MQKYGTINPWYSTQYNAIDNYKSKHCNAIQ